MHNLAIIPARGGSKRIPHKNIKDFLGKPIIAYSIEAALKSGLFDEIMVSTDDEKIAEVAKKYGAEVPFLRSKKNSDDFATTVDVLLEVIEQYEQIGKYYHEACCIYSTAPFISPERLKQGFQKLLTEKRSSVFSVVPFSYPIWRGVRKNVDGKFQMVWPTNLNKRSQDLDEIYHDTGQWYWFSVDNFKKNKTIFSDNSSAIILDPMEVQDIDTINDWKIAEFKYEYLQSTK